MPAHPPQLGWTHAANQMTDLDARAMTTQLEPDQLVFPPGFMWGASTSAYQIEGAVGDDGRAPSTWDTFCRQPGKVYRGQGAVAVDHYHRYPEDIEIMASLGLSAYRFSVAWPRVQPDGMGEFNQRGLDFYDRLVDGLLARGIAPFATLHHWDLPQALQDRGGWASRDTTERFARYAEVVHARLGDRVRHWATLNEPWCQAFQGHSAGTHAPGLTDPEMSLRVVHHLLLGHGLAIEAMRAQDGDNQFSIALNVEPVTPVRPEDPSDQDAARRIDGLLNRLFLDPIFRARYPEDVRRDTAAITDWSFVRDGDLAHIATPLDALSLNYYRPQIVTTKRPDGEPVHTGPSMWPGSDFVRFGRRGGPLTDFGWDIDPNGLRELLVRLRRDYPALPLYITENGAAFDDEISPDGGVHDQARIDYLGAHLRVVHEAIGSGVDLRGYFAWSLLDNFEWAAGYSKRFGIVHVDFVTHRRIVKDSGWWYRDLIAGNRLPGTDTGAGAGAGGADLAGRPADPPGAA